MNKQQNYLSDYEEDLVWMSYRYCIGRHTIAACMHARNIAKHTYGRLSSERQIFMAQDIRQCIQDCLRFGKLHIYFDYYDNKQCPIKLFLEALKELNLTDKNKLRRIKEIDISYNNNRFVYDAIKLDDTSDDISDTLLPDIDDLIPWVNLASCFDVNNHKMVYCKNNDTNEESVYEAFESYVLKSYDSYEFTKVWIPVKSYINNISNTYINPDYIVNIKNMPSKI